MLAPPSRLHPSPRADVEQVWRTNPLKIPCGHVPKPNQFFHSYFFCAPPLPRSASTTASAPVPAPPLCCLLFLLLAQHIGFYVNPCYLFESLALSLSLRAPLSLPRTLRQSGKEGVTMPIPALTALAIIQNQSLWFWQLANFSLLYHINFMSLVFVPLFTEAAKAAPLCLSLSLGQLLYSI